MIIGYNFYDDDLNKNEIMRIKHLIIITSQPNHINDHSIQKQKMLLCLTVPNGVSFEMHRTKLKYFV